MRRSNAFVICRPMPTDRRCEIDRSIRVGSRNQKELNHVVTTRPVRFRRSDRNWGRRRISVGRPRDQTAGIHRHPGWRGAWWVRCGGVFHGRHTNTRAGGFVAPPRRLYLALSPTTTTAKAFQADPGRYAPKYGGYCAFAVAGGGTSGGSSKAWRIVDGRLYLNATTRVQPNWEKDIPGYVRKADANWPLVLRQ